MATEIKGFAAHEARCYECGEQFEMKFLGETGNIHAGCPKGHNYGIVVYKSAMDCLDYNKDAVPVTVACMKIRRLIEARINKDTDFLIQVAGLWGENTGWHK